jgi:hypothetical protein
MFIEFRPNGLFVAIDGTEQPQVIEILEEVNGGTLGEVPPRRLLRTLDGRLVEWIDRGIYMVDGSRRLLRSDDPACI